MYLDGMHRDNFSLLLLVSPSTTSQSIYRQPPQTANYCVFYDILDPHVCSTGIPESFRVFKLRKHLYLPMHLSSNRKMHSELLTMTLYDLLQFRYNCRAMSTIQRLANSLGGGSAKRKISS